MDGSLMRFSRKASVAMLHARKLLKKFKTSDFTPVLNVGRCQFASDDVEPNPLEMNSGEKMLPLPAIRKNLEVAFQPRGPGFVNVNRDRFNICFSSP